MQKTFPTAAPLFFVYLLGGGGGGVWRPICLTEIGIKKNDNAQGILVSSGARRAKTGETSDKQKKKSRQGKSLSSAKHQKGKRGNGNNPCEGVGFSVCVKFFFGKRAQELGSQWPLQKAKERGGGEQAPLSVERNRIITTPQHEFTKQKTEDF